MNLLRLLKACREAQAGNRLDQAYFDCLTAKMALFVVLLGVAVNAVILAAIFMG